MKTTTRATILAALVGLAAGCQQKMADQPAHRPYEESNLFAHKQSARPIERGTIHANQVIDGDPLGTWLTEQGLTAKAAYSKDYLATLDKTTAAELAEVKTVPGAPTDNANFVDKLPFAMGKADFERGQNLFRAVCAECHGAAGHGNGKIPERGFLRPPSYHRDPAFPTANDTFDVTDSKKVDGAKDWSSMKPNLTTGKAEPDYTDHPQGFSRGFSRLGKRMALDKVNLGYIYQVITWGFGGMASHATQLPDPADRWRVVAYIRALQLSQLAEKGKLTTELKDAIDHPPVKKPDAPSEVKH